MEFGEGAFSNTLLFILQSKELTWIIVFDYLLIEFPSVERACFGDHSFAHSRLAPICGSLEKENDEKHSEECMYFFVFIFIF